MQNCSLIKLQHRCYRSRQFWLRTMKSGVISIIYCPQCLLKKGSGGRTLLHSCLPECIYLYNSTVQFPPFLLYLLRLRYCSLALHVFQCSAVTAFLCPLTSMMNSCILELVSAFPCGRCWSP